MAEVAFQLVTMAIGVCIWCLFVAVLFWFYEVVTRWANR